MLSEDEQLLSLYRQIRCLDNHKNISIVQHIHTKQVFIKKVLTIYDEQLYLALKASHISGTPKIFHVIKDGFTLIVIEEYIRGTLLSDYINRNGILDLDTSLHICLKLCDILSSLHSMSPPIIHRDITPFNILITSSLDVSLIDFNASKQFKKNKKKDTLLMGTQNYAAPEQFGFFQSDARTDIYALANLLNIMLTGFTPGAFLYQGTLSKVISKATSMDPNKRYPSVKRFRQLLLNPHYYFIPAGFRSKCPWKMITASLGYIFIGWLCFNAEFEHVYDTGSLTLYRCFTFLSALISIALCFNYMEITDRLPIARSSNIFVKSIGILLWSLFSFVSLFFILALILSVF